MPRTLEELSAEVLALPAELRAELQRVLSVSLDEETGLSEAEHDKAWRAQVETRLAEIDTGQACMVGEQEFFSRMRKRRADRAKKA